MHMQFLAVQALLFLYVVIYIWWVSYDDVGHFFAPMSGVLTETTVNFNVHSLCMSLGFPFFMSEALLMIRFRSLYPEKQLTFKYLHVLFHTCAMISVILGIIVIVWNHIDRDMVHMNSIHAWIGSYATALSLFAQYILGLYVYICQSPGRSKNINHGKAMTPFHQFFGVLAYGAGMMNCVLGLVEKQQFVAYPTLGYRPTTKFVPCAMYTMNFPLALPIVLALLVLMIAGLVLNQLRFIKQAMNA